MSLAVNVTGRFEPTKNEWSLGEDIVLRLTVNNVGPSPISFLAPHELSQQLAFEVVQGKAFSMRDPLTLPEGGFSQTVLLGPNEEFARDYSISQRVTLAESGTYVIRSKADLHVWQEDPSLMKPITIASDVSFVISG